MSRQKKFINPEKAGDHVMKKGKLKKKLKKVITLMNEVLEKLGNRIINEDKLESYTSIKLDKSKKKK